MFYEHNQQQLSRFKSIIYPKYKAYNLANFRQISQLSGLPKDLLFDIEVVGNVLPFKASNYIVNELINWDNVPYDPIYILTFPQRDMLSQEHYNKMASALIRKLSKRQISQIANEIRMELNPHPSGQLEYNIPSIEGKKIRGMQHKYNETALFFPKEGQTCHSYCTFCFRWPQFTGLDHLKFSMKEVNTVIRYLKNHPEISDLLITGGDPMVMSGKSFSAYIEQILKANIPTLKTIRIGSKSLSYWPYRFTTDPDADKILKSFENVVNSGRHLAFMAHFNHYQELKTSVVVQAINRINDTGAIIRTQSPVFRYINDDPKVWEIMWKMQTQLRCIPYYMFIARNTGAQQYFNVSLLKAYKIFIEAYSNVSGCCKTVRGPVMSCHPGKVQILGTTKIFNEEVFILRFIQARNPEWVQRPFFALFDEAATWFTDLKPAFGEEKFFFEDDLELHLEEKMKLHKIS